MRLIPIHEYHCVIILPTKNLHSNFKAYKKGKVKINLRTRILHNLLNQPQMQFSQSQSDFCCNNKIFTRETKLKVITNDAEWIYSSQEGDLNTKTVTATFFASVQYETNQKLQ